MHALPTSATLAFVGALEKVLLKPAYHRLPRGEESSCDRSGLKDLCPLPLVHSAQKLCLSPQPQPCVLLGLTSPIHLLSGDCCGV